MSEKATPPASLLAAIGSADDDGPVPLAESIRSASTTVSTKKGTPQGSLLVSIGSANDLRVCILSC
jgi:hypothetical protein